MTQVAGYLAQRPDLLKNPFLLWAWFKAETVFIIQIFLYNSWSSVLRCKICYFQGFPGSSAGKESACNAGEPGSIPGSERSPGEEIGYPHRFSWASLVVQLVKIPPAMQETWVWSLGWEDPLEKGKATPAFWLGEFHGLYSPRYRKELDMTEWLSLHFLS